MLQNLRTEHYTLCNYRMHTGMKGQHRSTHITQVTGENAMQIRNLCACVCAWGEETHQKRWIQLLLCSTRSDVHVDVHAHKSAENNRNGSRASHLPHSESARQGTALLVLRSLIWCFWLVPPFGGCRSDEQRRRKRFRWTTVAGGRDLGGGLYPPVAVAPKRAWTNLGLILAEHEQRKLLPPKFETGITPFLRVGWPFPTDSFSPQPTWSRLDGSAGNTAVVRLDIFPTQLAKWISEV